MKQIFVFSLLCTLFSTMAYSQSVIKKLYADVESYSAKFEERIITISKSKKIFILTNEQEKLTKGDFFTMALDENSPAARALVAKNHEGKVGIKILKIYSLKNWVRLAQGTPVLIYRGDDSFLFKPKQEEPEQEVANTINSEEDLYKDIKTLESELNDFYESDNRLIKPDNIAGLNYQPYSVVDSDKNIYNSELYSLRWAYQFEDNFWLEGMLGTASISNYPRNATDTTISTYAAKFRYTIKLPLYSYLLPYIGYQVFEASNGSNFSDELNNSTREAYNTAVSDLSTRNVILGATLLRRLVPGWFVNLDIDVLLGTNGGVRGGIGFCVEF